MFWGRWAYVNAYQKIQEIEGLKLVNWVIGEVEGDGAEKGSTDDEEQIVSQREFLVGFYAFVEHWDAVIRFESAHEKVKKGSR